MNKRNKSTVNKAMTAKAGDRPKNMEDLEAPPIKGSGVIEGAEVTSYTGHEGDDYHGKSI